MARKKEFTASDGNGKKREQNASAPEAQKSETRVNMAAKRKEPNYTATSSRNVYDVADLRAQLGSFGLTVRDIPGDGNCLFRALGDQLDGHTGNHLKHRVDTVHYMVANRSHFEPFIDVPFDRYVSDLSRPGTYAGQDALVAFARLHNVNIIIHQLNRPLWKIEGSEGNNIPELHLSYHNGEHYSSVRRFGDIANTPAGIRIMAPAAIPCCASHTVYTSTKPAFANANLRGVQSNNAVRAHLPVEAASNVNSANKLTSFLNNENHFTAIVHEIMNRTGCTDSRIATEALIDHNGDMNQAVDYLLSVALYFDPDGENDSYAKDDHCKTGNTERRVAKAQHFLDDFPDRHRTLPSRVSRIRPQIIQGTEQRKNQQKLSAQAAMDQEDTSGDLRFLTL